MRETPSQTAGPYVHIGCTPCTTGLLGVYDHDLGTSPILDGASGQPIDVTVRVSDGAGAPLLGGMIETWQADAKGLFPGQPGADPRVSGWARFGLDDDGAFTLKTIKPGQVGAQAPHISLWIVARGMNAGLQTRMYFGDEENTHDPLLQHIGKGRRATLIGNLIAPNAYRFDIRLQGEDETVFLDI